MSKKDQVPISSSDGEMTVLLVRLKGNNATLQQGFQALQHSISTLASSSPKALPARSAAPVPAEKPNGHDKASDAEAPDLFESETENEPAEDGADNSSIRQSPKRSFRQPNLVADFDPDNFDPPLAKFLETAPVGDAVQDKYLSLAYWLNKHAKVAEFSVDHIYTCYKSLQWPAPERWAKPLANLAHQDFLEQGSSRGWYKITVPGEKKITNAVKSSK
jgi:hypothetical protein